MRLGGCVLGDGAEEEARRLRHVRVALVRPQHLPGHIILYHIIYYIILYYIVHKPSSIREGEGEGARGRERERGGGESPPLPAIAAHAIAAQPTAAHAMADAMRERRGAGG